MITGTVPILAVWFLHGASIKLSATGTVLRKSGTLVVTKIAVAWVVAAIASRIIRNMVLKLDFCRTFNVGAGGGDGYDQRRTLRFHHAAVRHKEEAGAFVLMSLESGPLMTMIILGTAGIASFEPHVFVGAVLPFLVGFALGTLTLSYENFSAKRCRR